MEEWQKQIIVQNLDELAKRTRVTGDLLNQLVAGNSLNADQLQNLKDKPRPESEKSRRLYGILQTVPNSFEILQHSLKETGQTDAAKLLSAHNALFKNCNTVEWDRNKVLRDGCPGRQLFMGRHGSKDVTVKVLTVVNTTKNYAAREVELLKNLNLHENILRYLTVEESETFITIAFELVHNTLEDEVKHNSRNLNAKKVLSDCANGLEYLHKSDIVHASLSPSSILMSADGQAKIADLDVAMKMRAGTQEVSVPYDRMMDKDWMAPELLQQLAQENAQILLMSKATDVFSLGCIFFYVLSRGTHPFGNRIVRQRNICSGTPQMNGGVIAWNWMCLITQVISTKSYDRPSVKEIVLPIRTSKYESIYINRCHSESSGEENMAAVSEDLQRAEGSYQNHLESMDAFGNQASTSTNPRGRKRATASQYTSCFSKNQGVKKLKICGQQLDDCMGRGKHELHMAARGGNADVAQYLLETGADVSAVDNEGEMPIHHVRFAERNFSATLDALIAGGADVNAGNENGETLLGLAAFQLSDLENLKCIVSRGGDCIAKNKQEQSVVHLSASAGNFAAIDYFASWGVDVNSKDLKGNTALHQLADAKDGWEQCLEALLKHGANINEGNTKGNTLLALAASKGKGEHVLKMIVAKGGNVHTGNKDERSVLHLAAESGNIEAIHYFASRGIDVNSKDRDGETPLHTIVDSSNENFNETLDALLQHGADVNESDKNGNTLLFLAAAHGRSREELEYVVSKDARYNIKNKWQGTVLHMAASRGNVAALAYFISLGVDPLLKDNSGDTALHRVRLAHHNVLASLDILLANGANVNAVNKKGNTLLGLMAGGAGTRDQLKYVVAKDADVQLKNGKNQNLMHLAAAAGNVEALAYFHQLGVDIRLKDKYGYEPLHYAALTDKRFGETVHKLLDLGADINVRGGSHDATLLFRAIWFGKSRKQLEYILLNRGDYRSNYRNGMALIHVAAEAGNVDAIKYLFDLEVDLYSEDDEGFLPLHYLAFATKNFNVTLDTLLELKVDINKTDRDGDTILNLAILNGKRKAELEYMVSRGSDWTMKNCKGMSVAHVAASCGNVEALKYFFWLEVDLNCEDLSGQTPLHKVALARKNFRQTFDFLVNSGANMNVKDKSGNDIVGLYAKKGQSADDLDHVISRGGTFGVNNTNGRTVLHMAAESGNVGVMRRLLKRNPEWLEVKDNYGQLPLHRVCRSKKNFKRPVNTLLQFGLEIDALDGEENTLLGLAVRHGRSVEDIEFLLSKGADWKRRNKKGESVLDMARDAQNEQIVELLQTRHVDQYRLQSTTSFQKPSNLPITQINTLCSVAQFFHKRAQQQ